MWGGRAWHLALCGGMCGVGGTAQACMRPRWDSLKTASIVTPKSKGVGPPSRPRVCHTQGHAWEKGGWESMSFHGGHATNSDGLGERVGGGDEGEGEEGGKGI